MANYQSKNMQHARKQYNRVTQQGKSLKKYLALYIMGSMCHSKSFYVTNLPNTTKANLFYRPLLPLTDKQAT